MEQELITLQKHMRSLPVFNAVRVAQVLVFCVVLCRSLFVFSVVCVAQCLVFSVVLCRSLFVFSGLLQGSQLRTDD